jgi:exopolysaccharide biosynthesis protein
MAWRFKISPERYQQRLSPANAPGGRSWGDEAKPLYHSGSRDEQMFTRSDLVQSGAIRSAARLPRPGGLLAVRWSRAWARVGALLGVLLLLGSCAAQDISLEQGGSPLAGAPTSNGAVNDTGWQQADTALEFRHVRLRIGTQSGDLAILRLDPSAYRIRVAYDIFNPGRISEWADAVKPVALINGGYFDEEKRATALVIFDGTVRGSSYVGFGGMVVVNAEGEFELRSLSQQPYDPEEHLLQALQSSPMLIQPGGVLAEIDADDARSRRTVIARDTSGRILLIACGWHAFSLNELALLLKDSDLELDAALNLDGGRSTGMYLQTPTIQFMMDSFDSVPMVLVVDEKS